jgi:quercetin dioxygenase-like cupin family protein
MRSVQLICAAAILTTAAWAQDPVAVDPSVAKVVFENEQVRVLRVHYAAHQKFGLHSHPAKVALCLTEFHTRRSGADGTTSEATCPAGTVAWREPEKHAVENLADAPADTVEVELKHASKPAVAVTPPAAPAVEPMPAQAEPHHHVLFENQYVRAMQADIAPGDTTLFHVHAHDTVFIYLTDSHTASEPQGKAWEAPTATTPGQVDFHPDAAHPRTHRAKNVGSTPFSVLLVELLP